MAFRLQKPLLGARLDLTHPLADGLAIALPLNEGAGTPRNLVNNSATVILNYSPTQPVSWTSSQAGVALVAENTGDYVAINHPSIVNNFFSIEAIFYFNSATTNASPAQGVWSVGSKSATLEFQGTGNNEAIFFASGGGVLGPEGITYPALIMNQWIGVMHGSLVTFYQKGLPTVQATFTPSVSSFTQSYLFENTSGAGAALRGGVLALHAWSRPLSAGEVAERFADPWGIYRRAWNPRYFLKPASIAVLSTDSASIVDAASIAASFPLADSASLVDSASLSSNVILSDAGMFLDKQTIGAGVSLADLGTLNDTSFLNALISPVDGSTLVDSATASASIALFDSVSMIDLDSLAAFLSSLESASLIDSATTASTLSALDSAGFSETSLLGLFLAVADAAGLTENDVVEALTAAADSASLVDLAMMIELIFAFDSAGLIDSASLNRNLPTCLVGYASIVQGAPDPRFTKVTNL